MGPNTPDLATTLKEPIERATANVTTKNPAVGRIIGGRLAKAALTALADTMRHDTIAAPAPEPPKPKPAVRKMERPDPILIPRPPETEAERKELRAACKHQARKTGGGRTGKQLEIETERIYQASIAQSQSAIKVVRNQRVLIHSPGSQQPQQGERRTASGLIVRG